METKNRCCKCEHEWISRVENPATCPRCKTYYWKSPKKTHTK